MSPSNRAKGQDEVVTPCGAKSPPVLSADTTRLGTISERRARCVKPEGHEGNHATIRGDRKVWEWPRD